MVADREGLRRRGEILSAVGFVANALLQSSDWRESIDTVLERLGKSIDSNRAYFFENHTSAQGEELTSQKAEWAADGITPQIDNPDLQNFPWIESGLGRWLTMLKQCKPIYGLIADFPEAERPILESQEIQSLIVMPVFSQNRLIGFLGFDDCETLREWSSAEFDALLVSTTTLGAAIERQQLEQQLRFAQKMEAVGGLAAGVAHDFNNMLQAITSFTAIAKQKIDEGCSAQDDLSEVLLAAQRAHGLTQELLTFSRKQESRPTNINLNELCRSVTTMVRPSLGTDIKLVEKFQEKAPVIHADSSLVTQVILNLCINSRDAMPDGGILEISCARRTVDATDLELDEAPTRGEYAVLSVKDTGVGFSPELRHRVFEPFFTTKEVGRGTGLGLSVAYAAVKQSNGFIDVRTGLNQGAQFDVYFPFVFAPVSTAGDPGELVLGTETILLVDDEPLVLSSMKASIEALGYRVFIARSGLEGLEVYKKHADEIDLVLTDSAMPKMDGFGLRDAVLDINDSAKVIMLSGFALDLSSVPMEKRDNLVILQKPIRLRVLSKSIRDMLSV